MAGSARVQQVLEAAAAFTVPERVELVEGMAKRGLLTRRDYERHLKALEAAERAMNEDEPEASQDPLVFTKADMERQRKAILEFLSIPTVSGTPPGVSADKYSVLGKRDIEV